MSKFERSSPEVRAKLYRSCHEVQANFCRSCHKVQAKLYRSCHEVQANFCRSCHKVQAKLCRSSSEVFFAKFASKWKHNFRAYRTRGAVPTSACASAPDSSLPTASTNTWIFTHAVRDTRHHRKGTDPWCFTTAEGGLALFLNTVSKWWWSELTFLCAYQLANLVYTIYSTHKVFAAQSRQQLRHQGGHRGLQDWGQGDNQCQCVQ